MMAAFVMTAEVKSTTVPVTLPLRSEGEAQDFIDAAPTAKNRKAIANARVGAILSNTTRRLQ
jgi:hypothetical protein